MVKIRIMVMVRTGYILQARIGTGMILNEIGVLYY